MSRRKRDERPTSRQIAKLLSNATFNPRVEGPMSVIVDTRNPDYYETRATEFIAEAQLSLRRSQAALPNEAHLHLERYRDDMTKAMSLLALSMATRFPNGQVRTEEESR